MRYVQIGDARVSVIGLGTWQFGSMEWGYGQDYASATAPEIVNRALDLGINLIDTAEIYAFGRSERIVGSALASRRVEAFLATKLFPVIPLSPIVRWRGRASAARLGVKQIDLYQVHWPNPFFPAGSAMRGIRKLQESGVVRHAGVSNFPLMKWKEAERALGRPVLTNQVRFNLVARRPVEHLLPYAQENSRFLIAHTPLAQGFLSARYDSKNPAPGVLRRANPLFQSGNIERAAPLFEALMQVAEANDATPAQIALAWLVRKPNVVAIPGASSVGQLESNAAAADLDLKDDEYAFITAAAERFNPVNPAAGSRASSSLP